MISRRPILLLVLLLVVGLLSAVAAGQGTSVHVTTKDGTRLAVDYHLSEAVVAIEATPAPLALAKPGGHLHLRPEDVEQAGFMNRSSANDEGDAREVEGEIVAKFVGLREEDGVRLAAIELAVDYSTYVDMTDAVRDANS